MIPSDHGLQATEKQREQCWEGSGCQEGTHTVRCCRASDVRALTPGQPALQDRRPQTNLDHDGKAGNKSNYLQTLYSGSEITSHGAQVCEQF